MSQCDPSKICSVCDQSGLAIMPLRYAVAQPAKVSAPVIKAPFGAGLDLIPLPEESAAYTLRQLRGGYLYVFNEVRGTWHGYVVTADAYLLEYNIHNKTPPNLDGAKPCSRMAVSASSRCVMIPDAHLAGRIWLGFSDTAWTTRVFKQNRVQAYRKQHMRCIDIGAWATRDGKITESHLAAMSKAAEYVAEYAVPEEHFRNGIRIEHETAYRHSPQDFINSHGELEAFLQSAKKFGKGLPPAMVALYDPVGITMEINHLILGEAKKFEDAEDRDWKKTTSSAIAGLRQMMEEDAVATALSAHQGERYATLDGQRLYPEWDDEMRERNELTFATLPPAQEEKVRREAWARYTDNYNEDERLAFEAKLETDLEHFMQKTITPLVEAFIGWYWSDRFRHSMVGNHDPEEWDSGLCYTHIANLCLSGLTGHQKIVDKLLEDLRGHYSDLHNVTLRALVLNESQAASRLEEAATAELALGNPFAWRNILNAFDHVANLLGEDRVKGGLALAAGFAHQISGAIVSTLASPLKRAGEEALDLTIRYRMMAVLGMLTGKPIVSLQIQASQAQMVHIISEKVALMQPGIKRIALQKRISQELQALEKEPGVRTPTGEKNARKKKIFTWRLMYDESVLRAMNTDEHGRIKGEASLLVSQSKLREAISDQARQWPTFMKLDVGMGVVGGILDGWNAVMAAKQIEKEGWTTKSGVNMTAALFSLTGAGADIAHRVWSKYPVEQMRLGKSLRKMVEGRASRFGGLDKIARVLGSIGGFLTVVVDVISAFEAKAQGDVPVYRLRLLTAALGIAIAIVTLLNLMTAGIAFVAFLVLAGLSLLGEWLINLVRDNKIEVWLGQTPFGIDRPEKFESLTAQNKAWQKLINPNNGMFQ